jgi:arabinofuranosyltransferase
MAVAELRSQNPATRDETTALGPDRRSSETLLDAGDAPSTPGRPCGEAARLAAGLRVAALVVFGLVIVQRGWLSDDAFISLRSVDHLVAGRGLVFNVGERVQSFTNPLWVLLLALPHALVGEPYVVLLGTGVLTSLAAAWVLGWWVAPTRWLGALALLLLALSEAYGDFSTGGLENPLSHLLVLLFVRHVLAGGLTGPSDPMGRAWPWLCAGLALTTRMDNGVLLAFCLVDLGLGQHRAACIAAKRSGTRRSTPLLPRGFVGPVLLGLSPFFAWEAFALLYYGSWVPNTAVAKLGVQLPWQQVLGQGLTYLFTSLERDPLTPLVIAGAATVGFGRDDTRPLALGIVTHVLYVVWVGGDFMAGRFFTVPFVASVALLLHAIGASSDVPRGGLGLRTRGTLALGAAVVSLAALSPYRPFAAGGPRGLTPTGIVSERDFYRPELGIVPNLRARAYKQHGFWQDGRRFRAASERVVVHDNAGLTAYAAGPERHLVDTAGLTDPFVARLPFAPASTWRIGHYERRIPEDYLATLRSGENHLTDPRERALYERLRRIRRDPLFDPARLRAIYELQLGAFSTAKNASP